MELPDVILELTLEGCFIEFRDAPFFESLQITVEKDGYKRELLLSRLELHKSMHWISERLGKTLKIMASDIQNVQEL